MKEKEVTLAGIEAKLDTIAKLLALSAISHHHSLRERAIILQRAGLTPKEIAALCDTTPNTVSVALSTAKRGGKRQRR